MEIKKTLILESSEPLSKALAHLDEMPAVIITRKGKYFGVIDHRSIIKGLRDPKNTKCERMIAKPPVMNESAGVIDRVNAFLLGHFKALPVVDDNDNPVGITTRVELLKEMKSSKIVPSGLVSDVMSEPVFSISEDESIAVAKARLKEMNAHRLVVTRKGTPVGVVSTYDIGALKDRSNLSGGRKDIHLSENIEIDDMRISGFLRPDITVVEDKTSIEDAIGSMIDKEVSGVIVTSGGKAVGVLSAIDIFKIIKAMAEEKSDIHISGLGEENMIHYDSIKSKIGHVVEKFSKAFNIRNVSVRVKEEKSTFTVNVNFETDEGHISLKGERSTIKETVDELAAEMDKILRRRKEKRRIKPRASRYGGESGTDYGRETI